MKIISVTRILNEDDIVESFARHNARFLDEMIFLDNGSSDRTIEILTGLKTEGFNIICFRQQCSFFLESLQNTILYYAASRHSGADWVIFLDSDEFLDARCSNLTLRDRLSGIPRETACLKLNMINYQDSNLDDATELIVPLRIRRRWPQPHDVFKICLRGRLHDSELTVDAGNHQAFVAGATITCEVETKILLAHFVRRSPWQNIAKAVVGRLKVLAAGQEEIRQLRSSHYTDLFETLKRNPEGVLLNGDFMQSLNGGGSHLVDDPIEYVRGSLRYTAPTDYKMKAIRSIMTYMEQLAVHHGELLDSSVSLGREKSGVTPSLIRIF